MPIYFFTFASRRLQVSVVAGRSTPQKCHYCRRRSAEWELRGKGLAKVKAAARARSRETIFRHLGGIVCFGHSCTCCPSWPLNPQLCHQ